MIIDNTYFKGEIYIPQAKPSIVDSLTSIDDGVVDFIEEYERDCLLKCFGARLYYELIDNLDPTQPNGLSVDANQKWDDLLNGASYTDPNSGETVYWRGIRYKSNPEKEYDRSFIANYIYFFYERSDYITRSSTGHQIEKSKNAVTVSPTLKVVNAWNKFVESVQGGANIPNAILKGNLLGVDYYGDKNNEVSLYKFMQDSDLIAANTYEGFSPYYWSKMNVYGL